MKEKEKIQLSAEYMVDFVTALPLIECIERLERPTVLRHPAVRHPLARMTQTVQVQENDVFRIERTFPGALHPICLMGRLDRDPDGGRGTRVHAAITVDAANQILVEGMIVFLAFFLMTVMLYFRFRSRTLFITLPTLLLLLTVFGMRWNALRLATVDLARWVRQRLYATSSQVRK